MKLEDRQKKLVVAAAVLVVAGGVLVWGLSGFFSEGESAQVDPTVEQRLNEMQAEAEKALPPGQQNQPTPLGAGQPTPTLRRPGSN